MANGNSVMFDKGKILNCGGSEAFALPEYPGTNFASLITISTPNTPAQVKTLSPMNKARVYSNGVALPDGKVLITGGATLPTEFSDEFAHHQPGATCCCSCCCSIIVAGFYTPEAYVVATALVTLLRACMRFSLWCLRAGDSPQSWRKDVPE